MKLLFVVSERLVNNHVGEEYDCILEVEHQPTVETIGEWANKIRNQIRFLWAEQKNDKDKRVVVNLDAASPFNAMLINLKIIMKAEEGIEIELAYLKDNTREIRDRETLEVLKKLERK